MAVTKTYFAGKLCRKTPCMHPRSKHWHHIDLIIKYQCNVKDIHHARTNQSVDCDIDNRLVYAKINISLKETYCTKQPGHVRINVAKAQCPIASSLNDATTMWGTIKHGIITSTKTYQNCIKENSRLVRGKCPKLKPIFAEQCRTLLEHKETLNL